MAPSVVVTWGVCPSGRAAAGLVLNIACNATRALGPAMPAGVLGDTTDRRPLLLGTPVHAPECLAYPVCNLSL